MTLNEMIEELHQSVDYFVKTIEKRTVNGRILFAAVLVNECISTNKMVEDYYTTINSGHLPEELRPELSNWLNIDSWYINSPLLDESTYSKTECAEVEAFQCAKISITAEKIVYQLNTNIHKLVRNLNKLKLLLRKPSETLYDEYWNKLQKSYPRKSAIKKYKEWKYENDATELDVLKDKIIQETVFLLETELFTYCPRLSRREIEKSKLKLSEESLYSDVPVTDHIRIQCAKLSKYVKSVADECIPVLDQQKLSSYLYRYHNQITEEQRTAIMNYSYLIDLICSDIKALRPSLGRELCESIEQYYTTSEQECLQIIGYCSPLLQPSIKRDFIYNLWNELMADEKLKKEIFDSLTGQSKYTTICNIIGALLATKRVYKKETTSVTLAKLLQSNIPNLNVPTLKRYINNGVSNYKSALYRWIDSYICNHF